MGVQDSDRDFISTFIKAYSQVLRFLISCIVPFQFPLWEWLKFNLHHRFLGHAPHPWQSAACGALAGGFSAAVTTPLDVAKTRIMLAEAKSDLALKNSTVYAIKVVYGERGVKGLFAGVVPRVMWITIGGAIFFGVYEEAKVFLN